MHVNGKSTAFESDGNLRADHGIKGSFDEEGWWDGLGVDTVLGLKVVYRPLDFAPLRIDLDA